VKTNLVDQFGDVEVDLINCPFSHAVQFDREWRRVVHALQIGDRPCCRVDD